MPKSVSIHLFDHWSFRRVNLYRKDFGDSKFVYINQSRFPSAIVGDINTNTNMIHDCLELDPLIIKMSLIPTIPNGINNTTSLHC